MASIFSELYSDFRDMAKVYQEKLDVTAISFMRRFSRAIQEFQRDTEYVEAMVRVTRSATPPYFVLPPNTIRVIEVRDSNNRPMIMNDYLQWSRNLEIQKNNTYETPVDDDWRLPYTERTALGTVWNREYSFQNLLDHPFIDVYYIPDLPAFTAPSAVPTIFDLWASWFPIDVNFETQFSTTRLRPELAPFEQALLEKALSLYIRSLGNANYQVYENFYRMEVENAKLIKPTLWKHGVSDYFLAPYS